MRQIATIALLAAFTSSCYRIETRQSSDAGDEDPADEADETDMTVGDTAGDDDGLDAEDPIPDPVLDVVADDGPEEPETGIVGDPCYTTAQCENVPGAGRLCMTSLMGYVTFPGGYCSASCTDDGDCGPQGDCVNLADLGNYCLKRCDMFGSDCRTAETYECTTLMSEQTYCLPAMTHPEGSDY